MAVRAIAKAVEVFKRDRTTCPTFRPDGAVTYDQRILGWKGVDKVSLWTLTGREVIPVVYGAYQAERFDRLKGQVEVERFRLGEGDWPRKTTVPLPASCLKRMCVSTTTDVTVPPTPPRRSGVGRGWRWNVARSPALNTVRSAPVSTSNSADTQ